MVLVVAVFDYSSVAEESSRFSAAELPVALDVQLAGSSVAFAAEIFVEAFPEAATVAPQALGGD